LTHTSVSLRDALAGCCHSFRGSASLKCVCKRTLQTP
jgi:hypothetical protein